MDMNCLMTMKKFMRFAIHNNIRKGKPCTTPIPLYGYMYNDKAERIPDPVTSPVVVRIFNLYINGFTPAKIASILEEDKILAPRFYNFEKYKLSLKSIWKRKLKKIHIRG